MTIKPPGGTPFADAPGGATDGAKAPAGDFFARKIEAAAPAETRPADAAGVAGRYSRADLKDSGTLEKIVREALGDLVEAEWNSTSGLSGADKRSVVEFMAGDPVVRRQVERWLEKVLK